MWLECRPTKRRAASSTLSQGTFLGGGFAPRLVLGERQLMDIPLSYWCFSPSLSPYLHLSLKTKSLRKYSRTFRWFPVWLFQIKHLYMFVYKYQIIGAPHSQASHKGKRSRHPNTDLYRNCRCGFACDRQTLETIQRSIITWRSK